MVKDNVVALRPEGLRPFGDGRFVDLVDAVGRYLGDEHLRDKSQALVEGGVHPGDDQQEQEQQHEVDLPGQNQAGSRQDGSRYAQAHDHAGGIDKQAGGQFAPDGDSFMLVDLLIQTGQIPLLLVGGPDLPDVLQRLLDAVRDPKGGFFRHLGARAAIFRLPNSRPKATGTPHRQAIISRQS